MIGQTARVLHLDDQLGKFLRKSRGDKTFVAFAKKLGISPSTLFRLETCQQSATLELLVQILKRLRCDLTDIFSGPR